MIYLLALFIVLPMAELLLLIEIGRHIGTLPTLGLIVVTGIVGASLARWQGMGVVQRIRRETAQGRLPAGEMVDGVIILIAGAVLMTPGILTDAFGFFCLIPAGRKLIKAALMARIQRAVQRGTARVSVDFGGTAYGPSSRPVRNVTPPEELSDRDGDGNPDWPGRGQG